jgi:hypothetical protein
VKTKIVTAVLMTAALTGILSTTSTMAAYAQPEFGLDDKLFEVDDRLREVLSEHRDMVTSGELSSEIEDRVPED